MADTYYSRIDRTWSSRTFLEPTHHSFLSFLSFTFLFLFFFFLRGYARFTCLHRTKDEREHERHEIRTISLSLVQPSFFARSYDTAAVYKTATILIIFHSDIKTHCYFTRTNWFLRSNCVLFNYLIRKYLYIKTWDIVSHSNYRYLYLIIMQLWYNGIVTAMSHHPSCLPVSQKNKWRHGRIRCNDPPTLNTRIKSIASVWLSV